MMWIVVGAWLISGAIAYAWWRSIRVYALRQDIFDLRDELFDFAAANGLLDDPAYRELREHLNQFATTAGVLSIPFLAFVFSQNEERKQYKLSQSDSPEMNAKVSEVMGRSSESLHHYLFKCTAAGWLLSSFSLFQDLRNAASFFVAKLAAFWVYSDIERFNSRPEGGGFQYHS